MDAQSIETIAPTSNDNGRDASQSVPEPYVCMLAVAEFLGLSVATLRKWQFRNELPFPVYRIGRRLRFRLSEVDQWVRFQASQAAA